MPGDGSLTPSIVLRENWHRKKGGDGVKGSSGKRSKTRPIKIYIYISSKILPTTLANVPSPISKRLLFTREKKEEKRIEKEKEKRREASSKGVKEDSSAERKGGGEEERAERGGVEEAEFGSV